MRRLILALSILLVTGSCSGIQEDPPAFPPASPAPEDSTAPEIAADPLGAEVRLRPVAEGFSAPVQVTNAGDGSRRLFVVEQTGTVRVVTRTGRVRSAAFLDITSLTEASGEQGLLGLAFPPDHATSGRLYVNYTDNAGDTVVARYRVGDDPNVVDPQTAEVLLTVEQPFGNHNGGGLAFGPDGYLYIALGDGGSSGDPNGNGQNVDTLLGSILRVDVSVDRGYRIPADNPFATGGGQEEIWHYGLRNPWRFSFDRATGAMWIGDVGQDTLEEVDMAPPGKGGLNFGWNQMEGTNCYASDDCNKEGLRQPVTEYDHDQGCSITGGFVYRGRDFPVLRGGYLFSDICTGTIWAIDVNRGRQEPTTLADTDHAVSSFGESESGEIYLVDIEIGMLFQVTGR